MTRSMTISRRKPLLVVLVLTNALIGCGMQSREDTSRDSDLAVLRSYNADTRDTLTPLCTPPRLIDTTGWIRRRDTSWLAQHMFDSARGVSFLLPPSATLETEHSIAGGTMWRTAQRHFGVVGTDVGTRSR